MAKQARVNGCGIVVVILSLTTFAGCIEAAEEAPVSASSSFDGGETLTESEDGPTAPDVVEDVFLATGCQGEIMYSSVPYATVREKVPSTYGIYNLLGLGVEATVNIDVRQCAEGEIRGVPLEPFMLGIVGVSVGLYTEEQPGPPRQFVLEVWTSSLEVSAFLGEAGLATAMMGNATMSSELLDEDRQRAKASLVDGRGIVYAWDAVVSDPRYNSTWDTRYHFASDPEALALDENADGFQSVQLYGGVVTFRPDSALGSLWAGTERAAGYADSARDLSSRFVLAAGPIVPKDG